MKRIIRLLCGILAAMTLLSGAVSCKGKETPKPAVTTEAADETEKVSLNGYKIIRSESAGSDTIALAKALQQTLQSAGATVDLGDDWLKKGESPDANAKEILLGNTNRSESTALSETLEKDGWAITFTGKKLVLVATRERFLADAVSYLTETMLGGGVTLSVTPNQPVYNSTPYDMVTIATGGKSSYRIVRGESSHYTVTKTSTKDGTTTQRVYYDPITSLCTSLISLMKTQTGAIVSALKDSEAVAGTSDTEILIGPTNREESTEALENVPADGYVIRLIGKTLVLNAWSLNGVRQAEAMFEKLAASDCWNGDLSLPAEFSYVGTIGDTVEGIPDPDGVTLKSAYRGLDKTLEAVWINASAEKFTAYGTKLQGEGYGLYQKNKIADNLFAIWTKDDVAVYVSYFPSDGTLRVISETYTDLPETEAETLTKITQTKLTQLSLYDNDGYHHNNDGNFGMGYVFTLEDGSYFIVDGGGNWHNDEGDDAKMLYEFLQNNNEREDKKIVIAGWLFTHEHWDHVTNFIRFTSLYGKDVTLERVYWNFAQNYEHYEGGGNYGAMQTAFKSYPGCKVMKVHAGQSFWVRNINLEILYTHETLNPYPLMDFNDTSTVFRVKVGDRTVLFPGDISTQAVSDTAVTVVYKLYGEALKSDILQVGHHGWNGGSNDIYKAVAPKIALWPVEESRWSTVSTKYETSKTLLKMKEDGIIEVLHVAKDGRCTVTFEEDGSCAVTFEKEELSPVTVTFD